MDTSLFNRTTEPHYTPLRSGNHNNHIFSPWKRQNLQHLSGWKSGYASADVLVEQDAKEADGHLSQQWIADCVG